MVFNTTLVLVAL